MSLDRRKLRPRIPGFFLWKSPADEGAWRSTTTKSFDTLETKSSHIFFTHSSANGQLGLLPRCGYFKQCCYEHWGTTFFKSEFSTALLWHCWDQIMITQLAVWKSMTLFHTGCTVQFVFSPNKALPPHPLQHLLVCISIDDGPFYSMCNN